MTESLQPAKTLAEKMDKPAIGASDAYRSARASLLVEEIELRRYMERGQCQRNRRLSAWPQFRNFPDMSTHPFRYFKTSPEIIQCRIIVRRSSFNVGALQLF